jgi:hypothetical protein
MWTPRHCHPFKVPRRTQYGGVHKRKILSPPSTGCALSCRITVALSWLAHLIGDIHQPLHTGALVSARLYADGDRGGNAIQVRGGNLHSVWDRALREQRLERTMPLLLDIAREFRSDSRNMEFAHTRWLQESRDLLLGGVYPDAVISDVLRSENTGNQPGTINLGQAYEEQMRAVAAQRIAEAGVRLAQAMELL